MNPEAHLELVLARLEQVKKTREGYMARCPAHEDKTPSLSVGIGENLILLYCWAGCNVNVVMTAVGLRYEDLYYESRHKDDTPAAAKTKPAFTKEKRRALALEANACASRLQDEVETLERLRRERGWTSEALGKLSVGWTGKRLTMLVRDKLGSPHDILLYDPFMKKGRKMLAGEGRSRQPWPAPESVVIEGRSPLYIVEGEGTAISLASLGLPVVSLPGSIGKPTYDPLAPGSWRGVGWHQSWSSRFDTHRFVLIPDCDETGRMLMSAVHYDLNRNSRDEIIYLDISPQNTSGFDVGDWLKPARTVEALQTARKVLEIAVTTLRRAPEQIEDAREIMRSWFKYTTKEAT